MAGRPPEPDATIAAPSGGAGSRARGRTRGTDAPAVDVIVVGAGIGGLTAAALAANRGLSTLVIEAHNRPGGCAGDFALGGVLFPAGATLISGFEPDGLHTWVYERLGISHRAQPLA